MSDPTNAERQARHRKARALGYEHVAGYLPPKRAAKVRQWLAEAEQNKPGTFVPIATSVEISPIAEKIPIPKQGL